jgi:hypothetical protein
MRTTLTLLAILLSTPALATDYEVAADLGVVAITDSTYDRFDSDDAMPSWGLRGAVGLDDHFAVVGALRWGRQGVRLRDFSQVSEAQLATAYAASELAVGVRAQALVGDGFRPYASVSVLGYLGHMQLDDDPGTRNNPGQLRSTGVSLGGNIAGGFAILLPNESKITPAVHLEVGWTGVLPHGYSAQDAEGTSIRIGTLGYSSPTVRGGAGIRF